MTIFEMIKNYADKKPGGLAFIDENHNISYRKLWEILQSNRYNLFQKGIHNKIVVYKIGSQVKFAVDFLCLMSANCWIIPVSAELSRQEYKRIVTTYDIDYEIDSSFLELSSLKIKYKNIKVNERECGLFHLTSGTTGEPKLCVRSLKVLKEEGLSYMKMMSLQSSKIISISPIYHSFALGAAYMAGVVSGSTVYLCDKFVPRKIVEVIAIWRANVIIAVPIMIKAISNVSLNKKYEFSNLRLVLVGAGEVEDESRRAFKERFGIFVSSNYGSTETGGVISRITEQPMDSIGKEMDGVEIKIINQNGNAIVDGEEGEVYVKCKYMMSGYLGEETDYFTKDGFFSMGDIMSRDDRGYYYIKGRVKNMINVGGKKVNPKEVEDVLLQYPGIKDCVVYKSMRDNKQEIVKAIIVGIAVDESKLRLYMKENLASYKIPSQIEYKDSIKRNILGKKIKE